MKNKHIVLLIFLSNAFCCLAQHKILEGHVSYLSSLHVYVKFENTNPIKNGDTLSYGLNGEGILIVKSKSSTSAVCLTTGNHNLKINDKIYFKIKAAEIIKEEVKQAEKETKIDAVVNTDVVGTLDSLPKSKSVDTGKSSYSGRLTASTNSSIGQDQNFQRLRLAFNFNFNNIKGGRLSIQNYITFRHRYGVDQTNVSFYDDFKVYSLSLNYRLNNHMSLTFGRQINTRIANIGAIDGLQFDYKKNVLIGGVFAGSRPDFIDYRFNASLWQAGGYLGIEKNSAKLTSQTSFAFVEQRNESATDRRFAYLQHAMTAFNDLSVFGSLEMDMYQKINDTISNDFSMTSAYFSLRYRFTKKFSVTTSYDNRRNVIYYESNRLYIDQLLNQETRQGWRLMANYNLLRNVNLSASSFHRYQKSFEKPTKNYVFNVNFARFLGTKLMMNLNHNIIYAPYFDGSISGGSANYDLWRGKIQLEASFRKVGYQFNNSEQSIDQNIIGMGFSINIRKMNMLLLNYEGTFEQSKSYHRYFITASKRFKNSK